jgi:alkylmercury lyase-like protein
MATDGFDAIVRQQIYKTAAEGRVPLIADLAVSLQAPASDVAATVRRLAGGRALALQPDGEILMAEPFSAVPTAFAVRSGPRSWWASCIWDALGIPAMLKIDAEIDTSCQCCGQRLAVRIGAGAHVVDGSGVAHILLPASAWWNDIVFT